jgi:hypothetical protein
MKKQIEYNLVICRSLAGCLTLGSVNPSLPERINLIKSETIDDLRDKLKLENTIALVSETEAKMYLTTNLNPNSSIKLDNSYIELQPHYEFRDSRKSSLGTNHLLVTLNPNTIEGYEQNNFSKLLKSRIKLSEKFGLEELESALMKREDEIIFTNRKNRTFDRLKTNYLSA